VYTDDSDVLAACIHSGWVQGAFAEDVGELGLSILLGDSCALPPLEKEIVERPEGGPSIVPQGCELHVTVLILPTLEKYASSIRYGVKSREWGTGKGMGHDGLSFMILSVKWVATSTNSIPSKTPFSTQLSQAELDEEEQFARLFNGGPVGGSNNNDEIGVSVSNVRAEPRSGSGSGFIGIGTSSWWKKDKNTEKGKDNGNDKEKEMGKAKERSVELLAEAAATLPALEVQIQTGRGEVVERVTERMVENVNANANVGGKEGEVEVKSEDVV